MHRWGSQGLSKKQFSLQVVCGFFLGVKSDCRHFRNGLKAEDIFFFCAYVNKNCLLEKDTLKISGDSRNRANANACFSLLALAGGLQTEVSSFHKIPIICSLQTKQSFGISKRNLLFRVRMGMEVLPGQPQPKKLSLTELLNCKRYLPSLGWARAACGYIPPAVGGGCLPGGNREQ